MYSPSFCDLITHHPLCILYTALDTVPPAPTVVLGLYNATAVHAILLPATLPPGSSALTGAGEITYSISSCTNFSGSPIIEQLTSLSFIIYDLPRNITVCVEGAVANLAGFSPWSSPSDISFLLFPPL